MQSYLQGVECGEFYLGTKLVYPSIQTTFNSDSLFRYKIDGSTLEDNWNQATFSGNWPTATAANLPAPTSTVAYYCTTFDFYDMNGLVTI